MDNLHHNIFTSDVIISGVRQRKKQTEPISCPVCGITVRSAEMEHHFSVEVDRLNKIHSYNSCRSSTSSSSASSSKRISNKELSSQPGCSSSSSGNNNNVTSINSRSGGGGGGGGGGGSSSSSSSSSSASAATGTIITTTTAAAAPSTTKTGSTTTETINPKECWNTYQRIKNNRQARLKIKSRKRKSDDPICPVCNEPTGEDINIHVEMCLRHTESNGTNNIMATGSTTTTSAVTTATTGPTSDDESIDVESESFEEYEWAGQTRIRASSMLEGGYSAAGVGTVIINSHNIDEDEDLNVDVDDTQYGQTQYYPQDVIIPENSSATNQKEQSMNLYLRKLVVGSTSKSTRTTTRDTTNNKKSDNDDDDDENADDDDNENDDNNYNSKNETIGKIFDGAGTVNGNSVASTSFAAINNSNNSVPRNGKKIYPPKKLLKRAMNASGDEDPQDCDGGDDEEINKKHPYQHNGGKDQIIESLKSKLRERDHEISNKYKCLICLDEFRIPVVSICCWHVHCEECWLRTLGARKLCPQCNMITSPTDLRRIYM